MAEGQGGEKTEKATEKKREDTRKEGNVLKSMEINSAVCMVAMFAALRMFSGWLMDRAVSDAEYVFTHYGELSGSQAVAIFLRGEMFAFLISIAPFLAVALVVGVAINVAQVGFLYTTKPLSPKFSKINPLNGFKRLISIRALGELAKSILKIVIIGVIIYNELSKNIDLVVFLTGKDTLVAAGTIFNTIIDLGFRCGIALIILAVGDYAFQWWRYEKDIMMTKQEVKEEYKITEGDPEIKGKIKQKQREMGMMRMMQSVPEADVVITNPTHYAVALKYEDGVSTAPVVLAKGQDRVAQKIKEIAAESKVQIVENKPVAQALFRLCDVGQQIPEEMYRAVAEILAYVYRVKREKA